MPEATEIRLRRAEKLLDVEFDNGARFSLPAPFRFVAERRHFLSSSAPTAHRSFSLSDSEVSICGEILRFARTFFEQSTK